MKLPVAQHRISSIDDLRQATSGAQFEVDQLTSASVVGKTLFADIGGALLSSGNFSGCIRARGAFSERDFTFGILLNEGAGCHHWRREAGTNDVGIFPAGDDQDAFYHSGASYAVVTLTEDQLVGFAANERLDLPHNVLRTIGLVRHCESIGQILREVLPTLNRVDSELPNTFGAEIRDRLLLAFCHRLEKAANELSDGLPHIGRPERIVGDALAYIERNQDRPITIQELSSVLNVPRRTLIRAFVSVTSHPPADYIRVHRLNGVRRMLLQTNRHSTGAISKAATEWGFTHFGWFSVRYRQLFGETPSTTLTRVMTSAH